MPIVGKLFPSQNLQEKVFLVLRRHWFTYVGFLVIAFIFSIPLFVLIFYWVSNPEYFSGVFGNVAILVIFAYMLFTIGLMLYGFIDYYLDVYIITNERMVSIEQNGFFRREIAELHLHQIQDVSARVNGFLPTMFHYGDVFVQTAGERENFIFKSIPNPYRVTKLILDLHELQLEETPEEENIAQKTSSDVQDEITGKARDEFDLENVDPKSLSLARKRTKEFLKGGVLEETELKSQVEGGLSQAESDRLLSGIDNGNTQKIVNVKKSSEKANINTEPKSKVVIGGNEGELHENEETKI